MFSRINITFFFSLSTDIFFSPVNVVIKKNVSTRNFGLYIWWQIYKRY